MVILMVLAGLFGGDVGAIQQHESVKVERAEVIPEYIEIDYPEHPGSHRYYGWRHPDGKYGLWIGPIAGMGPGDTFPLLLPVSGERP